jgi:hypothetical protein
MRSRHIASTVVLAVPISLLAACSIKVNTSVQPPKATFSGNAGVARQVEATWETFFNGGTPVARKLALLQDGPLFASVITAQAGGPTASSTTARVSSVSVNPAATQAVVRYSIDDHGMPEVLNLTGAAIYSGGRWLISSSAFCRVLVLDWKGKMPSVCRPG